MVEAGSLENCYTRNGIVGSNPTLPPSLAWLVGVESGDSVPRDSLSLIADVIESLRHPRWPVASNRVGCSSARLARSSPT